MAFIVYLILKRYGPVTITQEEYRRPHDGCGYYFEPDKETGAITLRPFGPA
jgi:hypothetical protein